MQSNPSRLGSSNGLWKPVLSRSNQAGAAMAPSTPTNTASAAATGSTPRFQRAT